MDLREAKESVKFHQGRIRHHEQIITHLIGLVDLLSENGSAKSSAKPKVKPKVTRKKAIKAPQPPIKAPKDLLLTDLFFGFTSKQEEYGKSIFTAMRGSRTKVLSVKQIAAKVYLSSNLKLKDEVAANNVVRKWFLLYLKYAYWLETSKAKVEDRFVTVYKVKREYRHVS